MANRERWLANHAVTELWSGWDDHAVAWTMVPQWSFFQQLEDQQGKRIHVHYHGNSTSKEGDVWVDAQDVGPIGRPSSMVEPEWPHPSPPREEVVHVNTNYQPPTAPQIPPDHIPHMAAAAHSAEIDVSILAATAARESHFADRAYREEPSRPYVNWRRSPTDVLDRFPDGSLGPCQILRSNFRGGYSIDNDEDAYALAANYRIGALIIRSNFAFFPDDRWKAVAAYNVGKTGAKEGYIPANNYVDTILRWAEEYAQLFQPDQQTVGGGTGGNGGNGDGNQVSDVVQEMIQYGRTLLGTPYVFGGKFIERDKGIDCSGYVCEVLDHCGIHLGDRNFLSAEAIRQKTREIDRSQGRAGDLIFFQHTYDTPGASHIGYLIDPPEQMLNAVGQHVQQNPVSKFDRYFMQIGRLPQMEGAPVVPRPPAIHLPPPPIIPLVPQAPEATQCAFCGRRREEVQSLIGANSDPHVAICEGCVKLYADLADQIVQGFHRF
jgi:cell wall-associated NlpC family hydrolase